MFHFHKKSQAGPPEWLIVGLGNPGAQYELTRHNVGFLFLDRLAEQCGVSIKKLKMKSLLATAQVGEHQVLLVKPQTFMNNSGEAVRELSAFYKIPPERILVVFDDISLAPGALRIRRKGSDGGHNGIKSILYHLESDRFPRIKIGVGAKPHPDYDLAAWVLSRITGKEEPLLAEAIDHAVEAAALIVDGQCDRAMNLYNS